MSNWTAFIFFEKVLQTTLHCLHPCTVRYKDTGKVKELYTQVECPDKQWLCRLAPSVQVKLLCGLGRKKLCKPEWLVFFRPVWLLFGELQAFNGC